MEGVLCTKLQQQSLLTDTNIYRALIVCQAVFMHHDLHDTDHNTLFTEEEMEAHEAQPKPN
jgi:hypothetical protein